MDAMKNGHRFLDNLVNSIYTLFLYMNPLFMVLSNTQFQCGILLNMLDTRLLVFMIIGSICMQEAM